MGTRFLVEFLDHWKIGTSSKLHVAKENEEIQDHVKNNTYINERIILNRQVKESHEVLKKDRPDVQLTHILDREFDDTKTFEMIDQWGDYFIIRVKGNRLSNESLVCYTSTGKVSKKKKFNRLLLTQFKRCKEYSIASLRIKNQVYRNIRCVIGWDTLTLDNKTYSVVKVILLNENKEIFKEQMLLITNKEITTIEEAWAIYKGYILRFKIEVVFRFLKQNLGWEDFQVRDIESIKNILALAFF